LPVPPDGSEFRLEGGFALLQDLQFTGHAHLHRPAQLGEGQASQWITGSPTGHRGVLHGQPGAISGDDQHPRLIAFRISLWNGLSINGWSGPVHPFARRLSRRIK
jgi:hypothetical protein